MPRSQASFAQELSRTSKSQAPLFDESFEQFCQRDDLPEMDYIGIYGIWSWISDANRTILVDFIHRKLKVGGVLRVIGSGFIFDIVLPRSQAGAWKRGGRSRFVRIFNRKVEICL